MINPSIFETRKKINAVTTPVYEKLMEQAKEHDLTLAEILLVLARISHQVAGDLVKLIPEE